MGLTSGALLDSTYLIAAERRGLSVANVLADVERFLPSDDCGISVVSVMELAHGMSRADTLARAVARENFLQQLISSLDVYPVTTAIGLRAGRLDGELKKRGIQLALADLLIGVTALELGFSVVTRNVRHFELIPDLIVRRH